MSESILRILGSRGSIAVTGKSFRKYGGSTTCFLLTVDGESLVLDAGTGIMNLHQEYINSNSLDILISHTHIDHILGIGMFDFIMTKGNVVNIYSDFRGTATIQEQIEYLFRPPLWPVTPSELPAKVNYYDFNLSKKIGNFDIETLHGNHPNGISIYKIKKSNKTIVFATDVTIDDSNFEDMKEFIKDADMFICDGQYTPEEWPRFHHFGHSTWDIAKKLGLEANVKNVIISHHSPQRTDDDLDNIANELDERCRLAKEGDVIFI